MNVATLVEPNLDQLIRQQAITRTQRVLLVGGCGYIGSYLADTLRSDGFDVDVCDHLARGLPSKYTRLPVWIHTHEGIPTSELKVYDTVLWFAGRSSVRTAEMDPEGALRENVIALANLRLRMPKTSRLIYASSGSLYNWPLNEDAHEPPWATENDPLDHTVNAYDRSKACMDAITAAFPSNTVGLRMGTVCGFSPNLRKELVFNAMILSAMNDFVVRVANSNAWRSLLFLQDLHSIVKACILADEVPLFLNAASLSLTIGDLAGHIARHFRAEIEEMPSSLTYSFRMRTGPMLEMLSYNPSSTRLENHIMAFVTAVKKAEGHQL